MEVVKTKKNGLLLGFTVFIFLYLALINLFFSGFMNIFSAKDMWIPQIILIMLLPYALSTVNQIMKDRCFSVINGAFAISIALYLGYFGFNIMTMAARNEMNFTLIDIQNQLVLPSYGLISMIVYMVMARFAIRYKAAFHLIFGIILILAIMGFVTRVDSGFLTNIISI
ncbi:MAG: hypothetical protein RR751_05400 [Clostridia bacterium]